MSNVKISLCGPSNRPYLWEYFYEMASENTIDFEVVFVGNVKPEFELPKNMRFIDSNVNPNQAEFISGYYSTGELILFGPDDAHYSPQCLDKMYELYKQQNDYKCIVAPMKFGAVVDQIETTEDILKIINDTPNQEGSPDSMFKSLQTNVGGVMSRKLYEEVGMHDKRFVFGHGLTDVLLRAIMIGAKIHFCPDTYIIERKDLCPNWKDAKGIKYTPGGYKYLLSEWIDGDAIRTSRRTPVQSYEINDTLLITSQGEKGEWD